MTAVPYMPHIAFDTLAYANRLKDAGVDSKIAEVQAELQATVLTDLTTNQLATKGDLSEVKNEIEKLKLEVKLDFSELRNEFKNEILKTKNDILLKVGAMFGASTIILGALITILSRFH